jgi:hypothetical protein
MDHKIIQDIFGIEFQPVSDYLKKAVPAVKAALAKGGQHAH